MKLNKLLFMIFSIFSLTSFSQQIIFSAEDSLTFEYRALVKEHGYSDIEFNKSANNNCASAAVLTPGGSCVSGNTLSDNTQAGEIAPPCTGFGGGGVTDRTNWYRFTATSTQMVLDYMRTVQTNCATSLAVYGPFATGTGCLPTAAQSIYCETGISAGDPGDHNLLSGLVVGQDYLVQILNKDCGGGSSGEAFYCLGINNVATNNTSSVPSLINACGTAFNGNNQAGYYASGTGTASSNLDGNAGTTCSTCAAGNDVPFVINNDSWFNFCSANAGQWVVSFTVGTCFQTAPNNGLQMSILTGTSANLTNIQNAPNPTAPGATWNSATINLTAGQCAYLVVDGFAGDQCSYSYTLTNLTGGCVLLPVELTSFNVQRFSRQSLLKWNVESERHNDIFILQRSMNGFDWETVHVENSIGDHQYPVSYSYLDDNSNIDNASTIYYKLSQRDLDGNEEILSITAVKGVNDTEGTQLTVVPNPVNSDENISVSIESEYNTYAEISLTDLNGSVIATERLSIVKGANIVKFTNESVKAGLYLIQYKSPEESKSVKLLKL